MPYFFEDRVVDMGHRRNTATSRKIQPTELLVSRAIAKARLQEQIQKGMSLRETRVGSYEQFIEFRKMHYNWTSSNIDLLLGIFTTDDMANEYSSVSRFDSNRTIVPTLTEQSRDLVLYIDALIHQIESIIEYVEIVSISSNAVSAD